MKKILGKITSINFDDYGDKGLFSYEVSKAKTIEERIEPCYVPLLCPFCGSECEFETTTFGDSLIDYFRIRCKQKGHSLDWWENSKKEAVNVWNCRSNNT